MLELGCGSGHSLHYLAERGALELWGVDLSPVQIAFAEETLRSFAPRVRLIESPMEVNPGLPRNHFDLVLSVYGLGWTTDLRATMELVNGYLRPGGCLLVSGEHPVYSCLEWNGTQYAISAPYFTEGPREYASWKGVPIVIQRRTLGTPQCGCREGESCRPGALVLRAPGERDADHVHHQGTEAVAIVRLTQFCRCHRVTGPTDIMPGSRNKPRDKPCESKSSHWRPSRS